MVYFKLGTNGRRGKHGRGKENPRHLYLVLDDWSWGYTIREIDLSSRDKPGFYTLPSVTLRLEAPRGRPAYFAGAYDTKILAMHPMEYKNNFMKDGVLIHDVHMRTFVAGPRQTPDPVDPIYIPVGDKLFALAAGLFQVLYPPPCHEPDSEESVWTWHTLPAPPFSRQLVTCYGVHGLRRIFVSIQGSAPATFSFDTTGSAIDSGDGGWKHHGQWKMPFNGRAYFDQELDAWVGLSAQHDTIGHICLCDDVATDSDASHQHDLAMKVYKEKLFSEAPGERHIGASLVYMGGAKSEFCLLEGICIQTDGKVFVNVLNETGSDESDGYYSDGEVHETDSDEVNEYSVDEAANEEEQVQNHFFLRLLTFSLRYDRSGDLTTGSSRRERYFIVPREVTDAMLKYPVAFWL